jgi:hypothetical protein
VGVRTGIGNGTFGDLLRGATMPKHLVEFADESLASEDDGEEP